MKLVKKIIVIMLSVFLLSGTVAMAAEKHKKEMMMGHKKGMMMEDMEEHHKMMNEMMQSVSDLAGIVKDSVTDKAAKDKCDAIIARVGELIKRHDEMYKAHQQKMDEMMKSHQEKMKQRGEKMYCHSAATRTLHVSYQLFLNAD